MEKIKIEASEVLQELINRGTLTLQGAEEILMSKRREDALKRHTYSIWEAKGYWWTHIRDASGKLLLRKRKSRDALADMLIDYERSLDQSARLSILFEGWINKKLEYGEIQQQSYDRYRSEFARFFPADCPLYDTPIGRITEADLEDHIKDTISKLQLTRKGYSAMVTILRGTFRRAKKMGLTDISITSFFDELELPATIFKRKERSPERETFAEKDIETVTGYLRDHADIWNLALLLQFQTGLRVGELTALKWEDVEDDCLHVRRTEVKYKQNGKWTLDAHEHPKTDAGRRDVMLPPGARDTIKRIRRINPFGEYLITNRGKRIRSNTLNKRLETVCEACGVLVHSTHKIRKTYGTALLDARVEDSIVADQMGHKDVTTTRKLYYYCNKDRDTKLAQVSGAITF